jgi:hypothetical protein
VNGRMDMYLIGAFCDYSKAPKRRHIFSFAILYSLPDHFGVESGAKVSRQSIFNTFSEESNDFCSSPYYIILEFRNSTYFSRSSFISE